MSYKAVLESGASEEEKFFIDVNTFVLRSLVEEKVDSLDNIFVLDEQQWGFAYLFSSFFVGLRDQRRSRGLAISLHDDLS
jgi:hypothetical protein